jgi:predicted AlkP superfamily pyrophosphatase or phosphodiesterase
MNRSFPLLVLSLVLANVLRADAPPRPVRPIPQIERVLVISIDGLRPDRLLLADAPVLHGLIRTGTYTMWARTTAVSVTLPSHVSMLTGMIPGKHGIEWNTDLPLKKEIYPAYPTIFETAKRGGYTTAMLSGKNKFTPLNKPGTLDAVYLPDQTSGEDAPVAEMAVKIIREKRPEVLFMHLPATDMYGHKFGWGSPEQLAAIGRADAAVGQVLLALDEAGVRQSTLIIVSADHGGAGKTHGADDPRSRHIPWIANGPGVRKGVDLTQFSDLEVRTEDTAATALYVLGAPLPAYLDGKPILAAFENVPK